MIIHVLIGNLYLFLSPGPSAFANFTSLEVLDLSNNAIGEVALYAFDGLLSLQKLLLAGNNITSFQEKTFLHLERVTMLDMSRNPIREFQFSVFKDLFRLYKLELRETGLDEKAFVNINEMRLLDHLDVSGNSFSYLPYLMLDKLSSLSHLKIENAGVEIIDPNAFVGLRSLKTLDIAKNKLQRINREIFQPLESLNLHLQNNQLECDCGTKQFKDWVDFWGVILYEEAKCTGRGGVSVDIKQDKLDRFCSGVTPTKFPPKEQCGMEPSLTLSLTSLAHDQAVIGVMHSGVSSELTVSAILRVYAKEGSEKKQTWSLSSDRQQLTGLTANTNYVLCTLLPDCNLHVCLDFSTPQDPQTAPVRNPTCLTTEVTAGVAAVAAIITLGIGLGIGYLVLRGVCCCPGRVDEKDMTPPGSPSSPVRQTQPVLPMQLSHSYVPSGNNHRRHQSVVSDTYDAIPQTPTITADGGRVFYNPSYKRKERPRHANDPLPPIDSEGFPTQNDPTPSKDRRGSSNMVIGGIPSCYIHPTLERKSDPVSPPCPDTYLEPTDTFKRRPSKRVADPGQRYTLPDLPAATSEPYHVYNEASDVPEDLPADHQPSPATLKKWFATKPSLEDIKHQMECGTGRVKKFRRPALQNAARSISTPDILSADEKTNMSPNGHSKV